MTTAHHFHVRSDRVGATRWPVSFVAAGVVAAACVVVAIGSIGSSGGTAVVDLDVKPAVVGASKLTEPASALLDGAAFELAVNEAVASVTNGSALLHGTGFADAVTKAVAAVAN